MTTAAPRRIAGDALRAKIRTERGWAARRILGQKPWPKQIEMERAVFEGEKKATEVSGCVGSTKTFGAAMIALEWLMGYKPSRVFSIAPSFRQVDANIWGYIQTLWAAAKANGTPIGDDKDIFKIPKIELGKDWYYEGFSTDQPGNVHGIHGPNDLLILDDAQGIPQAIFDELENMMAGGNTRILMLYNRMKLTGPTYACNHAEKGLWNHVGINFDDLQAARAQGFELTGALGPAAEQAWRIKYKATSDFYRVKVKNLYPKQEANTLIPMDWIEAAFERKTADTGPLLIGGDVGAEGDDSSAQAPMRGNTVFELTEWYEPDTMVTAGKFVATIKTEEAHEDGKAATSKAFAFVDSIGIGSGVVNRMAEQTHEIEGHKPGCRGCEERIKVTGLSGSDEAVGEYVDGGVSKPAKEFFRNLRSQMWWHMRDRLDPANEKLGNLVALPRDMDLAAQLSCVKFRTGSDGRIEVEPKIGLSIAKGGNANWGIKRRLGFSPNRGDACVYVVWGSSRFGEGEFMVGQEAQGERAGVPAPDRFRVGSEERGVMASGVEDGGLDGVD